MTRAGIDQALWAFGRGSGIVALVLLTIAVAAGIAARSGRAILLPRTGLAEFHRGAALSATALVGLHMLGLLADPRAQLRLIDLLVPFAGQYRPMWLGFGTVAVDLLAAVVLSALLRHRIGPLAFRIVHWAAYLLWPVALLHAVGTGTDNTRPWLLTVVAACVLTIAAAVIWRTSGEFTEYRRSPR
ncbi:MULTISPECIES: ferric reductase-like transmembrane domain-containing protein [unclassified Nocardia]|uniref:ferric reductase-like transmembrane domain-containing protein n=1 Tax=unclassified Nocardia TaxID=2637762 RepID=UPI001CE45A3D|nr:MULTISPECIES: ferric reductase-like transmembrane domain-containing protein [unclassified Nocardia]